MAESDIRGDNVSQSETPGPIAFTAKLRISDSYPTHRGTLKFCNVMTNEGNGYDPSTGVFTCPRPGLYHFTMHVSVYGRGQAAIVKNGQTLVSLYHTSLPDKCSQVASSGCVVRLGESDRVWVDLWGSGRNDIFATEDNHTVFLGFCVAP